MWWNWERGRGEKGDLVISFPLGLSLFLPVESSYRHPVKKFDQKKWRITRLEKQANNFNTTSLQTESRVQIKFVKIASIGREKYERCFRQPACECDDRRDRTRVYLATIIGVWFPYDSNDC